MMQRFVLVPVLSALVLRSFAVPIDVPGADAGISSLQKRETCPGGGQPPCVCDGQFGIRVDSSTLARRCQEVAFLFKDKTSKTDGTLVKKKPFTKEDRSAAGNPVPQCDHIVELQIIANAIEGSAEKAAACKKLAVSKTLSDFREAINSTPNTVFLEASVNNAKGKFASGASASDGKAAAGVVDYLKQLKAGTPAFQDAALAQVTLAIKVILDVSDLRTLQNQFIANLEAAASKAASTAVAEGADTDNCALPGTKREMLLEFVKRVITGKPRVTKPPCNPRKKVPGARGAVAAAPAVAGPTKPRLRAAPARGLRAAPKRQ